MIRLSACFLLRVFASDGSMYPQSISVNDSRLLYDVPTDDPEWSLKNSETAYGLVPVQVTRFVFRDVAL